MTLLSTIAVLAEIDFWKVIFPLAFWEELIFPLAAILWVALWTWLCVQTAKDRGRSIWIGVILGIVLNWIGWLVLRFVVLSHDSHSGPLVNLTESPKQKVGFCTNCGKSLITNANFCSYCGNPATQPAAPISPLQKSDQDKGD